MKLILQKSKFMLREALTLILALALLVGSGIVTDVSAETLPPGILISALASRNAITDPKSLLRYALPIENPTIRQIQKDVEDISNHIKGKRWSFIDRDVKQSAITLSQRSKEILKSIPEDRSQAGQSSIDHLKEELSALQESVEKKDRELTIKNQASVLDTITTIEEMMVVGFPFDVPSEYKNLPQLKGRATVSLETTEGNIKLIIDGYNAPVNAGNFVDLVNRGFYDGLPFTRAEEFFVVQAGDPLGDATGFKDPSTGEYRTVPLEIQIKDKDSPIYGTTLEDAGYYLPQLALPFNAYGAIATARPESDPNGGSSQFFLYRFDTELTPPGFNLMDGRYSVFGYLIEGKEILDKITTEDKIISAKVLSGLENLTKS